MRTEGTRQRMKLKTFKDWLGPRVKDEVANLRYSALKLEARSWLAAKAAEYFGGA